MRRKIGTLILTTIMLCALCISACSLPTEEPFLPEFESEIFRYAVKTDSNGDKICYIVGLTEYGQEQTEIILPETIDGIPVGGIGYERRSNPPWYFEKVGGLKSENLTKFYVPFDEKKEYFTPMGSINCPNALPVVWKALSFATVSSKGRIMGYNLLNEYLVSVAQQDYDRTPQGILANVSYMTNYGNTEKDEYYWVDSYNETIISFIPPEPTRVGYIFCGWYREPECINSWQFDTDKIGKEIELDSLNFENYDKNDITFLYAKWINN